MQQFIELLMDLLHGFINILILTLGNFGIVIG
jgi:hypothetical protein